MLRCSEVARLHASDEIRSSPLMRRLAARVHLLLCRHCRRYVRELTQIAHSVRSLPTLGAEPDDRADAILRNVLGDLDPPSG